LILEQCEEMHYFHCQLAYHMLVDTKFWREAWLDGRAGPPIERTHWQSYFLLKCLQRLKYFYGGLPNSVFHLMIYYIIRICLHQVIPMMIYYIIRICLHLVIATVWNGRLPKTLFDGLSHGKMCVDPSRWGDGSKYGSDKNWTKY
jgi:hypothetical protein